MAQAPDQIRDEIEATRARMSETVEAIGYRADVKGRAKEAAVSKVKGAVEQEGRGSDAGHARRRGGGGPSRRRAPERESGSATPRAWPSPIRSA